MIKKRYRILMEHLHGLPLRARLFLQAIVLIVFLFFSLGIALQIALSKSLSNNARNDALRISRSVAEIVRTRFNQEIKIASAISSDPVIVESLASGQYSTMNTCLRPVLDKIGKGYNNLFITDRNGILRMQMIGDRKTTYLDLSDREYFKRAKMGLPTIAGPLISRYTSWTIIIVSAPIFKGDTFLGLCALSLRLENLLEIIRDSKIGESGYALITNSDGLVLAHPVSELIMKPALSIDPGIRPILEIMGKGMSGSAEYSFMGTTKICGITPVYPGSWNAVFTQNKDEIMKPLLEVTTSISVSGLLFLVLTLIAAGLFTRRIAIPVEKLNETLKQITASTNEAIAGLNSEMQITFANPAALRLFGKSEKELEGSPLFSGLIPDSKVDAFQKSLSSGKSWSDTIEISTTKGVIAVSSMILPIKDEDKRTRSYLFMGRDITLELNAGKKIRQAGQIESIGSMAAGIAHNFNNILAAILGYSELSFKVDGLPEKASRYIGEIIKISERARDLIKQIVVFNRQIESLKVPVAPGAILSDMFRLLKAVIPQDIELRIEAYSTSKILADPVQIHQIFMNMCTNAANAISGEGGIISVKIEDADIPPFNTLNGAEPPPGRYVKIEFSDNGCGINPEKLERIFEPFYTTREDSGGTGLGLAVVAEIIWKGGGSISVKSDPGHGTVFTILYPVTEESCKIKTAPDSPSLGGGERVLLVEDEKPVLESLAGMLHDQGYSVYSYSTADEALAVFKSVPDRFDIIISDNAMPNKTGLEMIYEIRDISSDIPVILITGFITPDIEKRTEEFSISDVLVKPILGRELFASLQKAVSLKKPGSGNLA